jgi:hypothetical protein
LEQYNNVLTGWADLCINTVNSVDGGNVLFSNVTIASSGLTTAKSFSRARNRFNWNSCRFKYRWESEASATTAGYLVTAYTGGQQLNPQTYFSG